jgi:cytochrome c556
MTAMPEDLGDNVAGVETLLRNHDNFERDATAIGTQLTALSKEAARLQQDYPDDPAIGEKQQSVEDAWETLQERTADRKLQLKASDDLQKFLAAVKALLVWTGDMRMNIFADDPARDVRQAEMLIKQHQSRRSEIENREADFDAIARFGQDLVDRSHFASKEITAKLQLLVNERNELWSDWNGREDELRLCMITTLSQYSTVWLGYPSLCTIVLYWRCVFLKTKLLYWRGTCLTYDYCIEGIQEWVPYLYSAVLLILIVIIICA